MRIRIRVKETFKYFTNFDVVPMLLQMTHVTMRQNTEGNKTSPWSFKQHNYLNPRYLNNAFFSFYDFTFCQSNEIKNDYQTYLLI